MKFFKKCIRSSSILFIALVLSAFALEETGKFILSQLICEVSLAVAPMAWQIKMLLAIFLAKVATGLRLRLPVIPRIKQIFTVIRVGLCQSLLLGREVVMEVIVGVAVPLKM